MDQAFRYDFSQGPREVRSHEDALQYGNNCIALAHLALEQLSGYRLSPDMHCYEMFTDHTIFTDASIGDIRQGDLVWFGVANPKVPIDRFVPDYTAQNYLNNWPELAVNHVGIYTGRMKGDQPMLLHASPTDGTNVIWPLDTFARYLRYKRIYRISRLMINSYIRREEHDSPSHKNT